MIRKVGLILALLFISAPLLFAQVPRTITLERATERANGDALALSDIDAHVIECGVHGVSEPGQFAQPLFTLERPPSETQIVTPESFVDGVTYSCRALTRDTDGLISAWTHTGPFTVGRCEATDCRPLPPRSIAISLNP